MSHAACLCVCVYVYVRGIEREREREKEGAKRGRQKKLDKQAMGGRGICAGFTIRSVAIYFLDTSRYAKLLRHGVYIQTCAHLEAYVLVQLYTTL